MKPAILSVHVLTCLVAVNLVSVYGDATTCCSVEDCCDDSCDTPTPYNMTLDEFAAIDVMYVNLFPADPHFAGVDNICFTYAPLEESTYLFTISVRYSNSYIDSESLILSQDSPGVFPVGSGTCSAEITVFDYIETDDCSLYLAYLCYFSGDCLLDPDVGTPIFGFSSEKGPICEECLESAMDSISRAGFPDQGYFIAPYKLPDACTSYCKNTTTC